MSLQENGVLYGGSFPTSKKITNNSLGEFLLKKLQSLGDTILLVSILWLNLNYFSAILCVNYFFVI